MSAWEKLKNQLSQGVADITDPLIRMLFEKMEQVKADDEERYRIYQETLKSLEMQANERVEAELRYAQTQKGEKKNAVQQEVGNQEQVITTDFSSLEERDRDNSISKGNDAHRQVINQLEKEVTEKVEKESPSVEVENKRLTFESIRGGDLIFQDDQKNQYRVDPKELPISLETRGMIEALKYMQSMSKDQVIKSIRDAEKVAKKEGRSVQEVYAERLQKNIMDHVMKSRYAMLNQVRESITKLDQLQKKIRDQEKAVNEQLGKLYQSKGKIDDHLFREQQTKLLAYKQEIVRNQNKYQEKEEQMTEILKRELRTMYPDMNLDHLNLKGAFEIATAAGMGQTFKNTDAFRDFLKQEQLTDLLKDVEKGLEGIGIEIEEHITFER